MTTKRALITAAGLLPIVFIWLVGFNTLDDIREAYNLACGGRVGSSPKCNGIDGPLDLLSGGVLMMILFYIFAAEGVRRILTER